jgi:hypothetical protein
MLAKRNWFDGDITQMPNIARLATAPLTCTMNVCRSILTTGNENVSDNKAENPRKAKDDRRKSVYETFTIYIVNAVKWGV